MTIMAKQIQPHGHSPNLILDNPPKSGWRKASEWGTWKSELPNAYVYRLRAVGPNGPVDIPHGPGKRWKDLLYVGETGYKDGKDSKRLAGLANGVTNIANQNEHSAAPGYWSQKWNDVLKQLDPDFWLEAGWDEQDPVRIPASDGDGIISSSNKSVALGLEDKMLRAYEVEHDCLPPLNDIRSPGFRDYDRKTKNTIDEDLEDRSEGEVIMGDVDSPEGQQTIEDAKRRAKEDDLTPPNDQQD